VLSVIGLLAVDAAHKNNKYYVIIRNIYNFNCIYYMNRYEVTGERWKLHNEELHILYSTPNIIRQIKSRRMKWAGHVARM
jgi:hypothetical protein